MKLASYIFGVIILLAVDACLVWAIIAPFLRGFFWQGCFFAFFMFSYLAALFIAKRKFKRQKALRFTDRDEIELDNIYKTHFFVSAVDKDCFEELWQEIAETLRFPAKKIRPDDRFDYELGPVKFNDKLKWIGLEILVGNYDDNDDLSFIAEERKKKMKLDIDISKIQTVRDYVLAFGQERTKVDSTFSD
jgi:hypothetical protein